MKILKFVLLVSIINLVNANPLFNRVTFAVGVITATYFFKFKLFTIKNNSISDKKYHQIKKYSAKK